jgi:hypothetical protein
MSRVEALKTELNNTKKEHTVLVGLVAYMAGKLNLQDIDTEDPTETLQKTSDEFTTKYGHEPINWVPDVPYDLATEPVIARLFDNGTLKRVTKADRLESLAREARVKETGI